jgi:hypothetical protein
MNIDDLMIQPRTDDTVMVQLRERCATEAFQMWIDKKMPGAKVKRVLAESPCSIAIVIDRSENT